MTEAQLWALIAVLALAGWGASLVLFARSTLPMANALSVTNKVDALVDDRIAKTLERIETRRSRGQRPAQPAAPPEVPPFAERGGPSSDIGRVFGGPPFDEQPDAEG